jgi:hypothetical protein
MDLGCFGRRRLLVYSGDKNFSRRNLQIRLCGVWLSKLELERL